MTVTFHRSSPDEIAARDLHDILRLRGEIFVVEQDCAFAEIDGRDMEPGAVHLWFRDGDGVAAALRVLVDGDGSRQIGRVVTRTDVRRVGLGARLMVAAVAGVVDRPAVVRAQSHLEDWYGRFGFAAGPDRVTWVEDGIPHVALHRPPGPQPLETSAVEPDDADLAPLVDEVVADLTGRYPGMEADSPAEIVSDGGAFFVTRVDGVAVGCGAVRRMADGRAELKRMFVRPEMRGRGIVEALLAALEHHATSQMDVDELFLVTGYLQPEAHAAYRREGFVETAKWGHWVDVDGATCLRRPVTSNRTGPGL